MEQTENPQISASIISEYLNAEENTQFENVKDEVDKEEPFDVFQAETPKRDIRVRVSFRVSSIDTNSVLFFDEKSKNIIRDVM